MSRAPGPIGPGFICHILGRQWVWGIDPGPVSRACGHDRKPMTGADMSAFILTDRHFSAIAYYCAAMNENVHPQTLADQLKRINIQSVNYRYSEKTRATRCKLSATDGLTHSDIVKLIQCWDYQSCENGRSLDYLTMSSFLHSFFTPAQIETARDQSDVWTI